MKAMVLTGKNRLELQDLPKPELHQEGVIVKVEATAICNATDLRIIDADDPTTVWPNKSWPFVLGHEVCGRIVEVGDKVEGWKVGDRIAGWCPPYGGFAEYCQMYPDYMAAVVPPDGMPADIAAMFELSIGTSRYFIPEAVMNVVKNAENALITGLGPSGLLYIQECGLMGIKNVYASGNHTVRRKIAEKLGAREVFKPADDFFAVLKDRGIQMDVIVDTTGQDMLDDFLRVIKPGGVLIPFGVGFDWNVAAPKLESKGVVVSSSSIAEGRLVAPKVLDWLSRGELAVGDIITRKIELEELPDAFEALRRREEIKIVVMM